MTPITAGCRLTLFVEKGRTGEEFVSLDSILYEVDGQTLVLAQTSPPVDAQTCDGRITLTYVVQKGEKVERLGFPVSFTRLIDEYETSPGVLAPAFAVTREGEPTAFSARRFLRVEPTGQNRLDLYVSGMKVEIADISLGGVRFSYDVALPLAPELPVTLRFDLAGVDYSVSGRILRITYNKGRFRTAVASFANVTGRFEQALVRILHVIQRALLQRD